VRLGNAFAALLCGALLVLPGCGGSSNGGKSIPRTDANHLIALIQRADTQSSAGTCSGAAAKVREAQGVANNLPSSVDKDVRRGIIDGLDHMLSLIQGECQRPQQTQTDTTPTDTTPTDTTQTETTQTDTTPTDTTPTDTSQTTTTLTGTTPTDTTPTQTGTSTGTTTTGTGGTPPGNSADPGAGTG
jgi:hypothetical protein